MAEEVKRKRRGVTNDLKETSNLRFHEKDADPNTGLFLGHLEKAEVLWSQSDDDKQFPGLKKPRLTFSFVSNHAKPKERRHVELTLFPVPSNVETIPGGKSAFQVDQILKWCKHIVDVFVLNGRELTEDEEYFLGLPFEDFDEDGNYVQVEPQEVLDGYGEMFNNVVQFLEGRYGLKEGETPKPYYKTADGKFKSVWMKLLRYIRKSNGWDKVGQSGELAFVKNPSSCPGGVLELQQPNSNPVIKLDNSRETIIPVVTEKSKENSSNVNTNGFVTINDANGGGDSATNFNMGLPF